jgi:hypothetical protein
MYFIKVVYRDGQIVLTPSGVATFPRNPNELINHLFLEFGNSIPKKGGESSTDRG